MVSSDPVSIDLKKKKKVNRGTTCTRREIYMNVLSIDLDLTLSANEGSVGTDSHHSRHQQRVAFWTREREGVSCRFDAEERSIYLDRLRSALDVVEETAHPTGMASDKTLSNLDHPAWPVNNWTRVAMNSPQLGESSVGSSLVGMGHGEEWWFASNSNSADRHVSSRTSPTFLGWAIGRCRDRRGDTFSMAPGGSSDRRRSSASLLERSLTQPSGRFPHRSTYLFFFDCRWKLLLRTIASSYSSDLQMAPEYDIIDDPASFWSIPFSILQWHAHILAYMHIKRRRGSRKERKGCLFFVSVSASFWRTVI